MARLGSPVVADGRITFDLEDDRNILLRTLPLRTYNDNEISAYQQPDRGRSRPLLFGTKTGIRPVQYTTDNWSGGPVLMGVYEVVDCDDWPAGIKEVPTVYWYRDDQAAVVRASGLRIAAPASGSDASSSIVVTLTTGRFTIRRDLSPVFISYENNKLDFDTGGALLMAQVTPGVYEMYDSRATSGLRGLTAAVQTAMVAVDGADAGCDWTDSTQKVKLSKGAGTLNLRCATGRDAQTGIWGVLGFDASADKTGSLVYNADQVVIHQANDQVLRVDAIGFKDDASGTYTGTASATIEKAPDIARFILQVILKVPVSAIDVPSFVTARATADQPCSLYIGSPRTVANIFTELETTGNMDLFPQGGIWRCVVRDTSVPAGTPELGDSDFLSFESYYNPEDLWGTVTIAFNEAPDGTDPISSVAGYGVRSGSRHETGEYIDPIVTLRHGRPEGKVFTTCLRDAADACFPYSGSRLEGIVSQAQTKRRRFRFSVKGKCLQVPVNGKIRLTRTRGLGTTGALDQVLVRVIPKRDDWARWVSEIEAIEVV